MWHLYSRHYEIKDAQSAISTAEEEAKYAADDVSDSSKTVERRQAAIAAHETEVANRVSSCLTCSTPTLTSISVRRRCSSKQRGLD